VRAELEEHSEGAEDGTCGQWGRGRPSGACGGQWQGLGSGKDTRGRELVNGDNRRPIFCFLSDVLLVGLPYLIFNSHSNGRSSYFYWSYFF